jgi:hypothetical protein
MRRSSTRSILSVRSDCISPIRLIDLSKLDHTAYLHFFITVVKIDDPVNEL